MSDENQKPPPILPRSSKNRTKSRGINEDEPTKSKIMEKTISPTDKTEEQVQEDDIQSALSPIGQETVVTHVQVEEIKPAGKIQ